jgi:hypothetical protein
MLHALQLINRCPLRNRSTALPLSESNRKARTLPRDSFSRGSVRAFLLDSETFVSRSSFKVVQMTDDVIARLRVIAEKTPVPPATHVFTRNHPIQLPRRGLRPLTSFLA